MKKEKAATEAPIIVNASASRSPPPGFGASLQDPRVLVEWMLGISEEEFFRSYFERRPLLLKRNDVDYYRRGRHGGGGDGDELPKARRRQDAGAATSGGAGNGGGLFVGWSTSQMREAVKEKELMLGTDLNVVRVDPATRSRVPFRTSGTIDVATYDKCLKEGWSVRFLRPQEHARPVADVIHGMEEYFACSGGANCYLTPGGSQGFAPHYDDVDVFLLQLEGKKEWRLYRHQDAVGELARHSSEDYDPEALPAPYLTAMLEEGDMLYMPRGTIHQGRTPKDCPHSMHVTFSANQMHSVADMVTSMVRQRIETLAANDVKWRRAVPREWFTSLGAIGGKFPQTNRTAVPPARAGLLTMVRGLLTEVLEDAQRAPSIDYGTDAFACDVLARRQAPHGSVNHAGMAADSSEDPDALLQKSVRLVSAQCIRLDLSCPGEARVHHTANNHTICMARPLELLRFEADFAGAISTLIRRYPHPVPVKSLPMDGFDVPEDRDENRLLLVETLLEAKVLVLE